MNDTHPENTSTPATPETASRLDLQPAAAERLANHNFSPTPIQVLNSIGPIMGPLLKKALAATPAGKPGWKTTEFWISVVCILGAQFGALDMPAMPALFCDALCVALVVAYAMLRLRAKREALEQAANATIALAGGGVDLIQGVTPAAVPISSEANGVRGEPATGSVSPPLETKPAEDNA